MPENQPKKVKLPAIVSVKNFAEALDLPISQIITELMKNGIMATINEEVDFETASIIAQDLGFETEEDLKVAEGETITLEKLIDICKKEQDSEKTLTSRPPIVTILGHVDHGKTTLLDTIRKASVASGEAGGITQHISAYQAKKRGEIITFVDTPGHEAFAAMRERGVSIADIAILVVAADDGVRPQTEEVIKYLKEKNIPTILAINKIDKPDANPQRVKQELADRDILIEEWGGKVLSNEISAKNNLGIDDLLESILLIDEVENFKSDAKRDGMGVVLESHLDPKVGPVSTILVKTGLFKVGQDIVAGKTYGRIKRIEDFAGKTMESAGPSSPITIIGLHDTPNTNDVVQVSTKKSISQMKSKKAAETISGKKEATKQKLYETIDEKKVKKLNIILKSDVQGSLEAIEQILDTIKSDEVSINYISYSVGNITESDIKMAATSKAIVYGFNVESTAVARRMAESNNVGIRTFNIIYELIEDVKKELIALLPPNIIRQDYGKMEVLAIFKTGKKDMIVGGKVVDGIIQNNSLIEVIRDDQSIGSGKLSNLQQNKINTNEVEKGNECGITFEGETKIKPGDILLSYTEEEKPREL